MGKQLLLLCLVRETEGTESCCDSFRAVHCVSSRHRAGPGRPPVLLGAALAFGEPLLNAGAAGLH